MDDSKNKNPHEVPEDAGTQPTSEEVSATVPDGSEAAAAVAEAIGEAERAAHLEEMMDREFPPAEDNSTPYRAENAGTTTETPDTGQDGTADMAHATDSGTDLPNAAAEPVPGAGNKTETDPVTGSAETVPSAAPAETVMENNHPVPAIGSDQTAIAEAAPVENAPPGRDRAAEWTELAAAHPEIVGTTLPDDIYRAIMTSELTPLRVYESMMLKRQTDRITQLEAEIAQLRQNAETAARAPVVGAAGAPVNAEPEDDFLRGFNSYR